MNKTEMNLMNISRKLKYNSSFILFVGYISIFLSFPALLSAQNAESFSASPSLSVPKNTTNSTTLSVTASHSPATMSSSWGIYRVWVNISISTRMEYLTLTLKSPDGISCNLVTAPGTITSYSNYQDTYFRDDAPMTLATSYAAALTQKNNNCGSWIPQNTFANSYNNAGTYTTNGTWTLTVTNTYNNVGTYTATMNNWGIEFRDNPTGDKTSSVWVTNSETGYPSYNNCVTPKKMDKYYNYYGRTRLTYSCNLTTDPPVLGGAGTTWYNSGGCQNSTLDNTIWYSFMTDAVGGTVNILLSYISKYSASGSDGYQVTVIGAASPCIAANWSQVSGTGYSPANTSGVAGATLGTYIFSNSEIVCTGLAANTVYYVCVDGNGNSAGTNCAGGTPNSDVDFQIEATGAIRTDYSTLPIELRSFSAKCEDKIINLNWSTYSETNNDYFTIEKSTDAVNYKIVTTVPGAGSSNSILNYEYTDNEIPAGNIYYRLKQTDYNGNYEYFSPVVVNCSKSDIASGIDVYPNPASNACFIDFDNLKSINVQVTICNSIGQVVFSKTYLPETDRYATSINISDLPQGIYFIHAQTENSSLKSISLIKQ